MTKIEEAREAILARVPQYLQYLDDIASNVYDNVPPSVQSRVCIDLLKLAFAPVVDAHGMSQEKIFVNLGPSFTSNEQWADAFKNVIEESKNRPQPELVIDNAPPPEPEVPQEPYNKYKDPVYFAQLAEAQAEALAKHRKEVWGSD